MTDLKTPLLDQKELDYPIAINSTPSSSAFFSSFSTTDTDEDEKKENQDQKIRAQCEKLDAIRARLIRAERVYSMSLTALLSSVPSLALISGSAIGIYFLKAIYQRLHLQLADNKEKYINQIFFNNQTSTNQTCYEITNTTIFDYCAVDSGAYGFFVYTALKQLQQLVDQLGDSAFDICMQMLNDICDDTENVVYSAVGIGMMSFLALAGTLWFGSKINARIRPYCMGTAASMIDSADQNFLGSMGINYHQAPNQVVDAILDKKMNMMIIRRENYDNKIFTTTVADYLELEEDKSAHAFVKSYFS